ncbi:hypothetical protein [Siminovitchia sp. FSL W7-1587]|uniref:hypothetical protein n=1 Tax=Siminovitchia sp. FSL W7-1587 TaxID=2954699 RepID=UPI0030CD7AF4
MPQQRLYYDYVDGELIPFWYVLTFQHRELNWDKPIHYYEAYKPFEYVERDEFDGTIISMTITLADFIFNRQSPIRIGLNIAVIKNRIMRYGVDPDVVRQFVLSTPEIDDLLALLPAERKISLVVGS